MVRLLAAAVIVALQILSFPVAADSGTATLSGVIRTAPDNAPLQGVRVYAGDPATGRIVPSEPTGDSGSFTLADLSPGTYELAVESGESLYVVGTPVTLAPGTLQSVQIKVDPESSGGGTGSTPSVWNNAFTASMIVLATAIVIGILVENATDDEDDASPI